MSCLIKMRAVREELSVNEKKITDFVLNNSALIRDYSSQNLAASVGVSQSSIIKFSQKLGYTGFTGLKLAIHEAVVKGSNGNGEEQSQEHDENENSIQARIYRVKREALLSTMELNEEGHLLSAVELLLKSQRIQIVALGAGSMVARNFSSMLIQLGKSVIAEVDSYIQLSSVATLGPGDLVIVISFSGQSRQMIKITKQAKKAGVSIISLTNHTANPIRSLADIQLLSVSKGGDFEFPQIICIASQQHVLDVLITGLLCRDSKARQQLELSQKMVGNF